MGPSALWWRPASVLFMYNIMKRAASADEHGRRGRQMRAQALQQIVGVAVATGGSTRDQLHGSEAAFGCLEAWAWGELSAPDIQKNAMWMYNDMRRVLRSVGASEDNCPDIIKTLAGLGSSGRYVRNIHFEFLTFLGTPSSPPPYTHDVPVRKLRPSAEATDDIVTTKSQFVLPHVLFPFLLLPR